jgi:hypothetical protein
MLITKTPTAAKRFEVLASDALRLISLVDERMQAIEQRLADLEAKSRDLRNRAPIRELNNRLQDAEIKIYLLNRDARRQGGWGPPAPGGQETP